MATIHKRFSGRNAHPSIRNPPAHGHRLDHLVKRRLIGPTSPIPTSKPCLSLETRDDIPRGLLDAHRQARRPRPWQPVQGRAGVPTFVIHQHGGHLDMARDRGGHDADGALRR